MNEISFNNSQDLLDLSPICTKFEGNCCNSQIQLLETYEKLKEFELLIIKASNEIQNKNEKNLNLENNIKELKYSLANKNKEILELKCLVMELERNENKEKENNKMNINNLNEEIDEFNEMKENFSENLINAEKVILALKNENENYLKKINQLEFKNNKKNKKIKEEKNVIRKLQNELEKKNEEIKEIIKNKVDFKSELINYEESKEILLKNLQEKEIKINDLTEMNKKLIDENEKMKIEINGIITKNKEQIRILKENFNKMIEIKNKVLDSSMIIENLDENKKYLIRNILDLNLDIELNNFLKLFEKIYSDINFLIEFSSLNNNLIDFETIKIQKQKLEENEKKLMNDFLENKILKEKISELNVFIIEYQIALKNSVEIIEKNVINLDYYKKNFNYLKNLFDLLTKIKFDLAANGHNYLVINEILLKKDKIIDSLVLNNQNIHNKLERIKISFYNKYEVADKNDDYESKIKLLNDKIINYAKDNEKLEEEKMELSYNFKKLENNLKYLQIEYDQYRENIQKNSKSIDFPLNITQSNK